MKEGILESFGNFVVAAIGTALFMVAKMAIGFSDEVAISGVLFVVLLNRLELEK